jgi:hypothetical protein
MAGSNENRGRSRRPDTEDREWSSTGGYLVAGRSRGRVMLYAVCTMQNRTRSAGFLVQPQNKARWVSWCGPQNRQLRFGDLAQKITTTVSGFGSQKQADYGLSIAPQNRWEDEDNMGHASRSSGLLHLEASWARVSQFKLKTGGGAMQMVHVASSRRSSGSEAEDGRFNGVGCGAMKVGPKYPPLAVISFSAHRGILVFCWTYK